MNKLLTKYEQIVNNRSARAQSLKYEQIVNTKKNKKISKKLLTKPEDYDIIYTERKKRR